MRKLNVITQSNTAMRTTVLATLLFMVFGISQAIANAHSDNADYTTSGILEESASFNFDLALEKTLIGSTTPRIGDTVQFEIIISNEADYYAANYTITDDISDGFKFLPDLNPGWKQIGNEISYFEDNFLGVVMKESISSHWNYYMAVNITTGI